MMERATYLALLEIRPGERPFLISRSTFPSSGHWTGHWVRGSLARMCLTCAAADAPPRQLGDNFSKWSYLRYNIQGVLQFQIFQMPMVGADTCGFSAPLLLSCRKNGLAAYRTE
jgi:alpha-glucosidase